MMYNQDFYRDLQNTTSDYTIYRGSSVSVYDAATRTNAGTVTHSGSNTFNSNVFLGAAGIIKNTAVAYTTASTGTAITPGSFITVSSTKTVKNLTLYGTTVGTELTLHCLNASATGYVQVSVASSAGATARTFDGTNYLYRFKKAGESVKILLASTARWFEVGRSVASGTALDSTST